VLQGDGSDGTTEYYGVNNSTDYRKMQERRALAAKGDEEPSGWFDDFVNRVRESFFEASSTEPATASESSWEGLVALVPGTSTGSSLEASSDMAARMEGIMELASGTVKPIVWDAPDSMWGSFLQLGECNRNDWDELCDAFPDRSECCPALGEAGLCDLYSEGAGIAEALHDIAAETEGKDAVVCHSQGCAALTYAFGHDPTLYDEYSVLIAVAPSAYKNATVEGFIDSGGEVVLMCDPDDPVAVYSKTFSIGPTSGALDSSRGVEHQHLVEMIDPGHSGIFKPRNPTSDYLRDAAREYLR
jgi:hypothetical protein